MLKSRIKQNSLSDKFILNNDEILFNTNDNLNLYQLCLLNNIQLPKFCYHEKLSVAGNRRICIVEIAKSTKPIISCSMIVEDKAEFFTNTKMIKESQEGIFEYLLINHPLDCPICDQGGECDSQDQTIVFGSDKGRFYESFKRNSENKNYGPLIKILLNRCIHCARCTRFL